LDPFFCLTGKFQGRGGGGGGGPPRFFRFSFCFRRVFSGGFLRTLQRGGGEGFENQIKGVGGFNWPQKNFAGKGEIRFGNFSFFFFLILGGGGVVEGGGVPKGRGGRIFWGGGGGPQTHKKKKNFFFFFLFFFCGIFSFQQNTSEKRGPKLGVGPKTQKKGGKKKRSKKPGAWGGFEEG